MDYELFDWSPRLNPKGDVSFHSLEARFGQGYVQRAGDGINPRSESWPLQFTGEEDYVVPIKDFLDRHWGRIPFRWTPPLGTEGLYVAKGYSLNPLGGDIYIISATFEQEFRP